MTLHASTVKEYKLFLSGCLEMESVKLIVHGNYWKINYLTTTFITTINYFQNTPQSFTVQSLYPYFLF